MCIVTDKRLTTSSIIAIIPYSLRHSGAAHMQYARTAGSSMRRRTAQQVQPLLRLAIWQPQPLCTGNCSIITACKDAAASQRGTAAAACAAESAAARAHSGRHAATSGRRLAGATSIQSSRAYAATAGTRSSPTSAAYAFLGQPAAGLVRWGVALRPLAACAISQPWHIGRQHTPYSDGGSARGFASQPIGRITPEGFTEKAWEVCLLTVSASLSVSSDTAQP